MKTKQRWAPVILLLFTLAILCTAKAKCEDKKDKTDPAAEKCTAQADLKELSHAAHERFIADCVQKHKQAEVQVTGEGSDKMSDAQKQKLINCGHIAAGRGLSGESLDRFLSECLSRQ